MVYYMPGETTAPALADAAQLTPRQIVSELDRYIVGQDRAKRAVAIALRNRIRRLRLPPEMAEEVAPKNIIMIGPTGVGKTEIARRLARLARSPFLKVEATKFTEVGYVGRDVESMVRDLTEIAIDLVRLERVAEVRDRAKTNVEERLATLLSWVVAGALFLTAFALAGLGFLLAWRIDSVQGFHGVANLFLIPLWLLSGALFPAAGASDWVRAVMTLNPLTYSVSLLRQALYFSTTGTAGSGPNLALSLSVTIGFAIVAGLAAYAAARRPTAGDGD